MADSSFNHLAETVVDTIGKAKAMEFYEKTKKIEEDGGMLIMNGSRRRTAGGIYLWLVKNDDHIPQEKIREIFSMDKKEISKQRKKFDATNRRQKAQQELRRGLEGTITFFNRKFFISDYYYSKNYFAYKSFVIL